MKYVKSTTTSNIEDLETSKVRIFIPGALAEGIWVRKDHENQKMYLVNNAVNLRPLPSWGLELPLQDEVDLEAIENLLTRGTDEDGDETIDFNDSIFVVHPEAYGHLEKYLDEEGNFDFEAYYQD